MFVIQNCTILFYKIMLNFVDKYLNDKKNIHCEWISRSLPHSRREMLYGNKKDNKKERKSRNRYADVMH